MGVFRQQKRAWDTRLKQKIYRPGFYDALSLMHYLHTVYAHRGGLSKCYLLECFHKTGKYAWAFAKTLFASASGGSGSKVKRSDVQIAESARG